MVRAGHHEALAVSPVTPNCDYCKKHPRERTACFRCRRKLCNDCAAGLGCPDGKCR